jgi:hypothetical protein
MGKYCPYHIHATYQWIYTHTYIYIYIYTHIYTHICAHMHMVCNPILKKIFSGIHSLVFQVHTFDKENVNGHSKENGND